MEFVFDPAKVAVVVYATFGEIFSGASLTLGEVTYGDLKIVKVDLWFAERKGTQPPGWELFAALESHALIADDVYGYGDYEPTCSGFLFRCEDKPLAYLETEEFRQQMIPYVKAVYDHHAKRALALFGETNIILRRGVNHE